MQDEDEIDDEPSPVAEQLAEWGAAIYETWHPADGGGVSEREVDHRRHLRGASAEFRELSCNSKLSPVTFTKRGKGKIPTPHPRPPFCSSTFAAIETTCPDSCRFKDNGCMADGGLTRILSRRLNRNARGLTELQVIAEEARMIDRSFGGGPVPGDGAGGKRALRVHVGGDVQSVEAARIIGAAAVRWRRRGGGSVWTFTHSWREIPREAWGWAISVLASCESAADVRYALERGYAPAIVLPELPADGKRMRDVAGSGIDVIPCPGETRDATCVGCRLCLDRPLAQMRVGIAFGVHGRDKRAAASALVQLGRPRR